MLGLGTGLTDTQTLTMLSTAYADRASQAFAIYKVCQHLSTGVSFAYAGHLSLYWQLGVLGAVGAAGFVGFAVVDRRSLRKRRRMIREKVICKSSSTITSASE